MYNDNSERPFDSCISPSTSRKKLSAAEDALTKDFLLKLYQKQISSDDLTVTKILGMPTSIIPVVAKARIGHNEQNDYYYFQLDISEIDSKHYLSLVRRETSDADIIALFDNETLNHLKYKNVTGAFIVSLIKQLSILKKMKGLISSEDFKKYIELTHKGFYGSNSDSYSPAVGF